MVYGFFTVQWHGHWTRTMQKKIILNLNLGNPFISTFFIDFDHFNTCTETFDDKPVVERIYHKNESRFSHKMWFVCFAAYFFFVERLILKCLLQTVNICHVSKKTKERNKRKLCKNWRTTGMTQRLRIYVVHLKKLCLYVYVIQDL